MTRREARMKCVLSEFRERRDGQTEQWVKKEGLSLIRLTGVGTSGGWGVGARGGDRLC